MEYDKVIKERRSIRRFTDEDISIEILESIFDEVRFSPSWKNIEPVRFLAIKDKKIKEEIAHTATKNFLYNEKTINSANTLIVVYVLKNSLDDENLSEREKASWQAFDSGIATQSLCLSSYNRGIGSVILGIFDPEKIKNITALSDDYNIVSLVCLGYPAKCPEVPKRLEVSDILTIK